MNIVFNLVNGQKETVFGNWVDMSIPDVYKVYQDNCLVRTFSDDEIINFYRDKENE